MYTCIFSGTLKECEVLFQNLQNIERNDTDCSAGATKVEIYGVEFESTYTGRSVLSMGFAWLIKG